MSFNFEVEAGKSVKLTTAGKYCDRDIVVSATGGGGYTEEDLQAKYDEGVTAGVEQGKQAEHDRFWDGALGNVSTGNCTYRFAGKGWTDETFAPTKNFTPIGSANGLFQGSGVRDVKGICERLGVTIDLSKATSVSTFFADSWVEHFGIMDLRGVNTLNNAPLFNAYDLISVDKIILRDDGSQTISNFANNCRDLVDIRIEGVIGASVNFQWSTKLSKASIESVMASLSPTTSGLSVTFSKAAVNKAFETSEGANDGSTSTEWTALANTRPNWTINLV